MKRKKGKNSDDGSVDGRKIVKLVEKRKKNVENLESTDDEKFLESVKDMPDEVDLSDVIFKLVMLEERFGKLLAQKSLTEKVLDERIVDLRRQKTNEMRRFEKEINETKIRLEELRKDIEKKYNIDLNMYSYDDETGVMKRLPDEILLQMRDKLKELKKHNKEV